MAKPHYSESQRRRLSEHMKKQWHDPKFRLTSSRRCSDSLKKKWEEDAEYRRMMSENSRKYVRLRFANKCEHCGAVIDISKDGQRTEHMKKVHPEILLRSNWRVTDHFKREMKI
jgi:hypothetical protein